MKEVLKGTCKGYFLNALVPSFCSFLMHEDSLKGQYALPRLRTSGMSSLLVLEVSEHMSCELTSSLTRQSVGATTNTGFDHDA